MKPVRRSHDCWFKLFKQHAKSGQSMKAFCEPLNIDPKYFSLRRTKLGYKAMSPAVPSAFIQVMPKVSQINSNTVSVKHTSGLSIEFNFLPPVEYLQELAGTLR